MDGKTMKIGEFAAKYGVTDRHARRLAAEHEADLVGHIEKRGNVGTWIDEYAEAYLRDLLRNPLEILPAEPDEATPAELQRELNEMTRRWAEAEQRASLGAAAAARLEAAEQKTLLLQDVHAETVSRLDAEHKAELAGLRAEYGRQIGDLEGTNRILQDNVEKAEEQIQVRDQQLQDLRADLDVAAYRLVKIRAKQAEIDRAPFFRRKKLKRELEALWES